MIESCDKGDSQLNFIVIMIYSFYSNKYLFSTAVNKYPVFINVVDNSN